MNRWIVLLRGVNVGGHNKVRMAGLRDALSARGASWIATYIQSGNIVVDLDIVDRTEVAALVADTISEEFGVHPAVLVVTPDELDAAIDANPFADDASEPSATHLFFTDAPLDSDEVHRLEPLVDANGGERLATGDRVLYLHAPNGIARSKLARSIDTAVRSPVTARNLRSALAVRDLARS